jgi:malyl-CoA/(S)-citramalyl-CoA lyase
MTQAADGDLALEPLTDLASVEADWRRLAERAGNPFTTWGQSGRARGARSPASAATTAAPLRQPGRLRPEAVSPGRFSRPMRNPRDFFKPLALDAPEPLREIPVKPSRMIHFLDFSNEKMVAKAPDIAPQVDILLGNLEDAIPVERKDAAREGLIRVGREMDLGKTALWTRVNSLESPWVLDDLTQIIAEIGDRIEVVMVPKVEGPWDIHYVDRLLAQLEAKAGLERPILVHAILETAQGVTNLEEIATASPRMQGMSFGPADLAANRRMKTTRVGGGHPGYRVIEDPSPDDPAAPRATAQQDPWHYSIARMVDACAGAGILPFYGPYGDIRDVEGCETQFRASFLLGCVGAWSLHPVQIDIAKKVFSPDPDEVKFAKKVIEAIPDGRGVHMIDGKMQDDATWKQCRVMVDLAEMLARKDPELAEAYELEPARAP